MAPGCTKDNCTVAETGTCIAENPPETCPYRMKGPADDGPVSPEPPLPKPERNPSLPHSRALTPQRAQDLMCDRYCTLVGILGDPDAGKTAALVSLYLLASKAKLKEFSFADSHTLMAFNEISQGALDWNEDAPPEQFTQHTDLADDRMPGFLHLRLRRGEEKIDFLLPDLPGEWSQSFIDKDRKDRLQFLNRADVIWLMMDGSQLREPSTRQYVVHRTQLLIDRLRASIDPMPPLVLVLTRRDGGEVQASFVEPIVREAEQQNLKISVAQIASFADQGKVEPGYGIESLMRDCRADAPDSAATWPVSGPDIEEGRAMLRYRHPEHRP
jgi:hypothetical protein